MRIRFIPTPNPSARPRLRDLTSAASTRSRWVIPPPDPIAFIFRDFIIQRENVLLEPEDPWPAVTGQVKVRALDGYLFVKNGKFVYPTYELPDEWWKGVVAYGYTAALTGHFRYFIWAGQWSQDYDEKHLEVVMLANLRGLSKGASDYWRNGKEQILWLDTEAGYSYALLEPAEEYDRGAWARVTASWANALDGDCPGDPTFIKVMAEDPRPEWWDNEGDDAWDYFFRRPEPSEPKSCQREVIEVDSESSWSDQGPPSPPKKTIVKKRVRKRDPKPKSGERPPALPGLQGSRPNRKRRVLSSTHDSRRKQKPKTIEHIVIGSSDEEGPVSSSPPMKSLSSSKHQESEAPVEAALGIGQAKLEVVATNQSESLEPKGSNIRQGPESLRRDEGLPSSSNANPE